MPNSNSKLKAIVSELERRRSVKSDGTSKAGSHLVAVRLNEYVPPPSPSTATKAKTSGSQQRSDTNQTAILDNCIDPYAKQTTAMVESDSNHNSIRSSTLRDTLRPQESADGGRHDRSDEYDAQSRTESSIICERCGKCRCSRCRSDRQLPPLARVSVNDEPCTVDTLIDTVTCMRLVGSLTRRMRAARRRNQARRKHSACQHSEERVPQAVQEEENDNENENDCEGDGDDESVGERVAHWSVVTALSVVLPCVVCYWPLRGARAAATRCYNAPFVRTNVCHCRNSHRASKHSRTNDKRRNRALRASFRSTRVHRFVKASASEDERPFDGVEVNQLSLSLAEMKADRSIRKLA